ncbi:hypothetical protein BJY01DRAFT_250124 [Aspergillus pseudoustus]|uniref:Ankyrin repeat-containing domain protein n=1 Tax=Aspergillus pseudoustus TaxID=1810923 RepID=A0ABR4JKX3_9EURO
MALTLTGTMQMTVTLIFGRGLSNPRYEEALKESFLLIENGARLETQSEDELEPHDEPFRLALYHEGTFKLLVDNFAYPINMDDLHTDAVRAGNAKIVQILLDRKRNLNEPLSTLFEKLALDTIAERNEETLKTLLQNGFTPKPEAEECSIKGLCLIAAYGNVYLLEALKDHDFEIWSPEWQAELLFSATPGKNREAALLTVDFLLAEGLAIDAQTPREIRHYS